MQEKNTFLPWKRIFAHCGRAAHAGSIESEQSQYFEIVYKSSFLSKSQIGRYELTYEVKYTFSRTAGARRARTKNTLAIAHPNLCKGRQTVNNITFIIIDWTILIF